MDGASGPVELPPGADAEFQYDDDDDIQAVQSEADNYLIDQSEDACRKVGENVVNENAIEMCRTKKTIVMMTGSLTI